MYIAEMMKGSTMDGGTKEQPHVSPPAMLLLAVPGQERR